MRESRSKASDDGKGVDVGEGDIIVAMRINDALYVRAEPISSSKKKNTKTIQRIVTTLDVTLEKYAEGKYADS